jgi:hypothetical protein
MTTTIEDQPAPIHTGRRATWDIVMSYVELRLPADTAALVLADMRDRDKIGKERYGVRLTSHNGRDHLVDAYQEILDSVVYLANELDEHDADPEGRIDSSTPVDVRKRLLIVQQLFVSQIRALVEVRHLIAERSS